MIPKILHDEALHSFMQRIVHLNGESKQFSKIKALIPRAMDNLTIKTVAATLGWRGCRGFNQLLHNHTNYALQSIIKEKFDPTYSNKKYVSRSSSEKLDSTCYKYCAECCRNDIADLGFPYWRSNHQLDVNVCGVHNVKLISACPYCCKPFTSGYNASFIWPGASRREKEEASRSLSGHMLDVLWLGCSGRSICDVISETNLSSSELKRSLFIEDLLNYGFYIPWDIAAKVLSEKMDTVSLSWAKKHMGDIDEYWWLYSLAQKVTRGSRFAAGLLSHQDFLRALVAVYRNFEEFIAEVNSRERERRTIESLWSTFAFGGRGSLSFIE